MGCVCSKLVGAEEEEVVSICKDRKELIKQAMKRRHVLAESHCRYYKSLYGVASAIKLFVARHSSPTSPVLIGSSHVHSCYTTPRHSHVNASFNVAHAKQNVVINNPMFLQQIPADSTTHETIFCECSNASNIEHSEPIYSMPPYNNHYCYYSPRIDQLGWDFFNPFDTVTREFINGPEVMNDCYYNNSSDSIDDDSSMAREEESEPEEEKSIEAEECVENAETAAEKEFLHVLNDIHGHFLRACDSCKSVSMMLETDICYLQSGFKEIKENPNKLIQAITWNRFRPAPSSSRKSATWAEFSNGFFDEYGGTERESHSLTLGRLYAWETKLYEEVKAGDSTRKIYERKSSHLKKHDKHSVDKVTTSLRKLYEASNGDEHDVDKMRAEVGDFNARILVAVRSVESISKRIEKVIDEELLPQIMELLKGLTQTWEVMMESHETQTAILLQVNSFKYGKFSNDSHRLATLRLEAELQNWRTCFIEYVAAQRHYVESLYCWLTKFLAPEVEFHPPYRVNGPPLLMICHTWLSSMEKLPKAAPFALKRISRDLRALWTKQGEELKQKRKVDCLSKEVERRTVAIQRLETRFLKLEPKLSEYRYERDASNWNYRLTDKRGQLDMLRRKLDMEKEKHYLSNQETERFMFNEIKTGFSIVFESLTDFSRASLKMYNDLLINSNNAQMK